MSFFFASYPAGSAPHAEDQVIELNLFLPAWQAGRLEQMAREHNVTVGQLLRRLIRAAIAENQSNGSASTEAPYSV